MIGAGADGEFAERHARIIVHAVNFLDAEAGNEPVLHHGEAAAAALLRRLKDHDGGAGEIAGLGEIFGGAEQHRGMAVMAAGVHLARHGRFDRAARFPPRAAARPCRRAGRSTLLPGFAAANDADHAGAPDAGHDLVAAEAFELLGDRGGRAVHVELEFRDGRADRAARR